MWSEDDAIRRLQTLHGKGSLTDEQFAQSKAAILANAPLDEHVAEIVLREELAELDGQWELERDQYLVQFKQIRYLPTKGTSVLIGVVMVAAGAIWTAGAHRIKGALPGDMPNSFSWFGVLFTIAWLGFSVYSYLQADRYERASEAYQRRREQLISRSLFAVTQEGKGS
jgi:hypothetical protein